MYARKVNTRLLLPLFHHLQQPSPSWVAVVLQALAAKLDQQNSLQIVPGITQELTLCCWCVEAICVFLHDLA